MSAAVWPSYRVQTRNTSARSENKMHDDAVARQYGFRGGLVPGVTVYSHMTRPLVEGWGAEWLARGSAEVRFARPAYEDEWLNVADRGGDGEGAHRLVCRNAQGVELAQLSATLAASPCDPDARAQIAPAPPSNERPEVSWEAMRLDAPFPALAWTPNAADNLAWCEDVRDDLALYRDGVAPWVHPGLLLKQCNNVLKSRFYLPAWIHTASRVRYFAPLRIGQSFELRCIPEAKWQRKGHEFVCLYIAVHAAGRTLAEVLHTAIFRPRRHEGAT